MALLLNGTDAEHHYGYHRYGYGYGRYGYGKRYGYGYYGNSSKKSNKKNLMSFLHTPLTPKRK